MQNNENVKYIQEDEIDLRELFKILWDKKWFIAIVTIVITVSATIYTQIKTPTFQAKVLMEIGTFDNNSNSFIENPPSMIKKLKVLESNINSILLLKGTNNLIEIKTQAVSKKAAEEKLETIVNNIITKHDKLINDYKKVINIQINNLVKQKEQLEKKENQFEGSLAAKFEIIREIDRLNLLISNHTIKETELIGRIIAPNEAMKPKKNLIVAVSFVTGFILSIFLVFFMQFIKGLKEDK